MYDDRQRLVVELIKLLLQVAWADDRIVPDEAMHIIEMARGANLSDDDMILFYQCLKGQAPLPPPDFGFLRAHMDAALAEVERLIMTDKDISKSEIEILKQVRQFLGAPD